MRPERTWDELADLLGESPNHLDDLFKELEDWEAILKSLPNLQADQVEENV